MPGQITLFGASMCLSVKWEQMLTISWYQVS